MPRKHRRIRAVLRARELLPGQRGRNLEEEDEDYDDKGLPAKKTERSRSLFAVAGVGLLVAVFMVAGK